MSETTITPAMTPEMWATLPAHLDGLTDLDRVAMDPHYRAAVCLYGQPFGFTHADVVLLRNVVDQLQGIDYEQPVAELADRIAALLPPE